MKKIKEVREEATQLFSNGKYADARIKFLECINSVKEFDFPNVSFSLQPILPSSMRSYRGGCLM